MRTLLIALALCALPISAFAQQAPKADTVGVPTKQEHQKAVKEEHKERVDAAKAAHLKALKEHDAEDHTVCKMVVTHHHKKHMRCS